MSAQLTARVAVLDVEVLGLGPSVTGVKSFQLFKVSVLPADVLTVDTHGAGDTDDSGEGASRSGGAR